MRDINLFRRDINIYTEREREKETESGKQTGRETEGKKLYLADFQSLSIQIKIL